jgi:hypothetical protein
MEGPMNERTQLLDDTRDGRIDPGRRLRLLTYQSLFTVAAVVCLVVEAILHEGTPWLVVLSIALLCLALALTATRYFVTRA